VKDCKSILTVQMDTQLAACSPVKAKVQLVLNRFHHFSFTNDTFTVSVHATAHIIYCIHMLNRSVIQQLGFSECN